jgi:hypothetical protein
MEFGSPPGHITLDLVRRAKELGFVVGSASDRTIADQMQLWTDAEIEVDFVSLKHRLIEVKQRFAVSRYLHIGDTDGDRECAVQAGFDFLSVHEMPNDGSHDWLLL